MTRILISEPDHQVRRLLERMLTRLGHEPVAVRVPAPDQFTDADLFVVEPAAPLGAVLAQAASIAHPALPIVCASVTAPPPELAELGVVFTAALVKPFTIEQLDAAIEAGLRERGARRNAQRTGDPWRGDRAA
jgi:DNA-binding response OmpR family regulator